MQSKFLSGIEGAQHLLAQSRYNFKSFRHTQIVKIWPGQYFGIYRYDDDAVNPIILAKTKIINIGADDNGVNVQMIDCKTNDLYRFSHVPSLACGYEIGVGVPQRAYIERTIKQIENGAVYYGVSTGMLLIHRSDPDDCEADVDYISDWFQLRRKFTDDAAFQKEADKF